MPVSCRVMTLRKKAQLSRRTVAVSAGRPCQLSPSASASPTSARDPYSSSSPLGRINLGSAGTAGLDNGDTDRLHRWHRGNKTSLFPEHRVKPVLMARLLVACLRTAGRYNKDGVTPAQHAAGQICRCHLCCPEIAVSAFLKAASGLLQRTTTSPQVPLSDGCSRKLVKHAHEEAVCQADLGGGTDGRPGNLGAQRLGSRHPCLQPVFMEAVATPGAGIIHLAQALQTEKLPDLAALPLCKNWMPGQAEKTVACAQALQEAAATPEPACSQCGGGAAATLRVPAAQEAVCPQGRAGLTCTASKRCCACCDSKLNWG